MTTTAVTPLAVGNDEYAQYLASLGLLARPHTLEWFQSEESSELCIASAKNRFGALVESIQEHLRESGIAAVDIPELAEIDSDANTVGGVATVLGLFSRIGVADRRQTGGMPFTLHTASYTNVKRLNEAGLGKFAPDAKLGFHNDGVVKAGEIEIPRFIAVYNLYLAYQKPGNFSWVPTHRCDPLRHFELTDRNGAEALVSLTPRVTFDQEGKPVISGVQEVRTPIAFKNPAGEVRFFLNGDVEASKNTPDMFNLFRWAKDAIAASSRMTVPQRERRVIFVRNTHGFHARDIFEDPYPGTDLTRVYLRVVDMNSERCSVGD